MESRVTQYKRSISSFIIKVINNNSHINYYMGNKNNCNYFSYDIFDTCLARICGSQDFAFELLAKSILGDEADNALIYDFILERKKGEEIARKKSKKEDITIIDIYNNTDFSFYTDIEKRQIIKKELEIQDSVLSPIHEIKTEIDDLHTSGKNIIYISDMYLPMDFIKFVLKKHGFYIEGDYIYISSETGLTKSSGHLYSFIQKDLNIRYNEWQHKGDNKYSDYLIPQKLGIHAKRVYYDFSYYERLMTRHELSSSNLDILKHASCARATRLFYQNTPSVDFATDFIASTYVPFVYSILKDADERGLHQLFFISRDGYILLKIAEVFHSSFPNIKLEYLYASRKSLYFPGINDLSLDSLLEVFPANKSENIYDLLSYLQLTNTSINVDDYLGMRKEDIIKQLLSNQNFINELSKRHEDQRKLCIQYFEKIGLTKPYSAIVDIYGTRKSGKFINNILLGNGYNAVFSYYYGVMENRIKDQNHFKSIIYNERIQLTAHSSFYSQKQNLLEQYFSMTGFQRTCGYKKNRTDIEPIFESDNLDNYYKKTISNTNIMVCVKFAEFYSKLKLNEHDNCCRTAQAIFNSFIHIPRKEYLLALKDFNESDNGKTTKLLYKAPIIKLLIKRSKAGWFPGLLIYNSGIMYKVAIFLLTCVWKYKSSKILQPY